MSYRVRINSEAWAELKALPAHVRAQARPIIDLLAFEPRPSRAKELRGMSNIFRIWLAGKWRIADEVDDEERCMHVLRVRRFEAGEVARLRGLRPSAAWRKVVLSEDDYRMPCHGICQD